MNHFIFFRLAFLAAFASQSFAAEPSNHRVSVVDFGALGDGRALNTQALQRAIDHAAEAGGGTVVVPEGVFTTGALFLKPGVNLHLEKNAVLRGSTNIEDYPKMPTRIEGHIENWRPALINASHADHLRITGEGTIEGSGQPFWQEFWRRLAADKKTKNLDVERPRLFFIGDSSDVIISGLTLRDSGFWNLHLYGCHDVRVENLSIEAPIGAPSSDGIDIDSCRNVTVHGCFISVDDDCIALKGSKGPFALVDQTSQPVEHVRVEDCTFGHGGAVLTLGSEATLVRDVVVEHCRVVNPTPLRRINIAKLKLRPDTPQTYEDIHFNDISGEGNVQIVSIQPWTQYFDLKGQPPPESTVRNITVSNIRGNFDSFGVIQGHDKAKLSDLCLEAIHVQLKNDKLRLGPVENLVMKDVVVNGKPYQR